MLKLVRVRGRSMLPTLSDGDYIITKKARPHSLRPGLIYVVSHPEMGRIVKRLISLDSGFAQFSGDGSESNATEIIGNVPLILVRDRAVFALTPKGVKRL